MCVFMGGTSTSPGWAPPSSGFEGQLESFSKFQSEADGKFGCMVLGIADAIFQEDVIDFSGKERVLVWVHGLSIHQRRVSTESFVW